MIFGGIKNSRMNSPLDGLATVRPKGGRRTLDLVAPVMLTSLVDAFAIIVVYLLVSTQSGARDLKMDNNINLPHASTSKSLDVGVSIEVANGQYHIDGRAMNPGELLQHLTELSKSLESSGDARKGKLIIQADKKSDFKGISPVLSIAAQSGFETIKFAVMGD